MASFYTFRQMVGFTHQSGHGAASERASQPSKRPCGTIWPNGEFGLGYAPSREESTPLANNPAGGVSYEHMRAICQDVAEGGEALDLTSLPNPHKPTNRPKTYGRRGMTSRGAKVVRNAGFCLQRDYGRGRLTFLTLTLPPMDKESAVAVASTWGETIRQLMQWLSRRLTRRGLPSKVVLVTELQSQRLSSGDVACLHVHAVFCGRHRGKTWGISPREVRAWWCKRLSKVTNNTISSPSCCDMKAVKRDAGNYLSKYMSKGSEGIERFAEEAGWDAVPRQWWNVTKEMRSQVKSECLRSESAMLLLDCMVASYWDGDADEAFKFVRSIEVKATEYQSFVVGFWGRMTDAAVGDVREMVRDTLVS